MKIKFRLIIISILISLFWIISHVYVITTKSNEKNLDFRKADMSLSANDLVSSYKLNEEKSDHLYSEKIIVVDGIVKEITYINNRITIILKSNAKNYGVICDINPNQIEKTKGLKKNQQIQLKGICKGFLRDVILINCNIEIPTNE